MWWPLPTGGYETFEVWTQELGGPETYYDCKIHVRFQNRKDLKTLLILVLIDYMLK